MNQVFVSKDELSMARKHPKQKSRDGEGKDVRAGVVVAKTVVKRNDERVETVTRIRQFPETLILAGQHLDSSGK